jgi:hypothetical protein
MVTPVRVTPDVQTFNEFVLEFAVTLGADEKALANVTDS